MKEFTFKLPAAPKNNFLLNFINSRTRQVLTIVLLVLGLPACTELMIARLNSAEVTETKVVANELFVMGLINSKSYQQLKNLVEEHPQVDTLVLTIMPGSIDDETNLKMCNYVRDKKLNTHLRHNSVIASGAVDLFMAGVERTMEDGAMLGVHSWGDGNKVATDYPRHSPEHKPYTEYYQRMVGSDDFYWYTIEVAAADEIHWMDSVEIEHHELLTKPVLSPSSQKIPFEHFLEMRNDILEP